MKMENMKKIITKLNEYVDNYQDRSIIVEMARINDKSKFKYDVFVNGGNSYGKGRNEHGEPHFHYSDNIDDPQKFKLSILIKTHSEWEKDKNVYIAVNDSTPNNWNKLKKEKSDLIVWLDKPFKYKPDITNYEFIRMEWNVLNDENLNVRKVEI